MLDAQKVTEIADAVARRIAPADLERVVTEPATDSEGNAALRIIVVLKPDATARFGGDNALDLLVGVQHELRREGEERFPIIEYATEGELDQQGDDEDSALREDDL